MSELDDYLATVSPEKRALIEHYYARVTALVPEAVPGRKYAMPCYVHRGKGLLSVMATKAGLSIIPFSGTVGRESAGDFEVSAGGGSLHCTPEHPFPDDAFDELVRRRVAEIEAPRSRS